MQNEGLHGIYCSPDIIGLIKSRQMGWTCHTHGRADNCMLRFGGKTRGEECSLDNDVQLGARQVCPCLHHQGTCDR